MSNVGFKGGSSLFDMGSPRAMSAFFDVICAHQNLSQEGSMSLLADRLYKRYVRREDVEMTRILLRKVKELFAEMPSNDLLTFLDRDEAKRNGFNVEAGNLALVFGRYFDAIEHCMESAEVNFQEFATDPSMGYSYEPVRVVRSQMPAFIIDKRIPLSTYDNLQGEPLWSSCERGT